MLHRVAGYASCSRTAMARRPLQAVITLLVLLHLATLFLGGEAILGQISESQNDSIERTGSTSNDEIERIMSFAEETLNEHSESSMVQRREGNDADGQIITIPNFMDHLINSAISSVDRMSSGLLSGLTGPSVEYGRSDDGKRLIVRLHLPPTDNKDGETAISPKLSVAVLGRSHLRVKLDMRSEGFTSLSEHTYGLPVHVSSDGVTLAQQEDGTIHIALRILKEIDAVPGANGDERGEDSHTGESFLHRMPRHPLIPVLFQRERQISSGSESEVTEELPKPEDLDSCRSKHQNERILRRKCICDVTPSNTGRAVCYGSLISKAVKVARRLGMNDFATSAKHHAIECADDHADTVSCLEKIASELLQSLYRKNSSRSEERDFLDRVRVAIESEDDGPSMFEPSRRGASSLFLVMVLVLFFVCAAMLCSMKRLRGGSRSNRILSELSSVLTQTGKTEGGASAALGKQGSRLRPFQGTAKAQSPGRSRRANVKPGPGEFKSM